MRDAKRNLLTLILLTAILGFVPNIFGQQTPPNWRAERMALESRFGDDLQEIGNWSRANGIPRQVDETFKVYQNRDLRRQYIFIPSEESMPTGPDNLLGEWLAKLNEAKVAHADRIFQLAQKASENEAGAVAFQLLHDVVHYNRDHEVARKMLGHKKTKDGWQVASDRYQQTTSRKEHDLLNWPAKSYIRVLTPHFEIESTAGPERTRYLATKLERWHLVWRQVFFEYWSTPGTIKRWFAGQGAQRESRKRFRVIFLKDRNEYLQQLMPIVNGIQVSEGYYSKDQRVSFFYDGTGRVEDTWRHELTHQLFRESGGAKGESLEEQFIWLDEGIATYFESMTDFGSYVTLGGFDARRIQFARVRRILENFHLPMAELSELGREELQKRADIFRIYSEAAGLTDMLMNDDDGAYEQSLTEFLRLMYRGKLRKGSFPKIMNRSFADWDARYPKFLTVDSATVEKHLSQPERRTELSLPGADLQDEAFEAIAKCTNLNWIDLSRNSITAEQFIRLRPCKNINQMILTECQFTANALRGLELFPLLDELDLSGSSVQDVQLANFGNLKKLKTLRLTTTNITDRGLQHLAAMPNLTSLDISRTKVTQQGILQLRAKKPNLQITTQ